VSAKQALFSAAGPFLTGHVVSAEFAVDVVVLLYSDGRVVTFRVTDAGHLEIHEARGK
jgi:hypothetical protein